jgi:hypothetical protein
MTTTLNAASRAVLAATAAVVLLLTALPNGYAADKSDPAPKPTTSPLEFVPPDAVWFVSVRVGDLWAHPAVKAWGKAGQAWPQAWRKTGKEMPEGFSNVIDSLEQFLDSGRTVGVAPEEIERFTVFCRKAPENVLTAATTLKPYDRKAVLAAAGIPYEERTVNGRSFYIGRTLPRTLYFVNERTFLGGMGEIAMADYLRWTPGKKDGPAAPALRLASEKHLAVVSVDAAALVRSLPPSFVLPPEALPYKELFKTQRATLVVDLDDQLKANLRLTFADEADAKEARTGVDAALSMFRNQFSDGGARFSKVMESAKVKALLDDIQAPLKAAKADQKGATVEVEVALKIDPDVVTAALTDSVRMLEKAAKRDEIPNDLKQLAMTLLYHASANNGLLPAAARYGKNGKPVLSWRVMMLPYIGEGELYQEFHLDEPWDSEHNKKLLEKMPEIFAPKDTEAYKNHETFFQVFVGKGTAFEPPAKPQPDSLIVTPTAPSDVPRNPPGPLGNGLRLNEFLDGPNAIMLVEAKKAVPWTKPDDIPFDDGKMLSKVGGLSKGGFWAVTCDGSVRFIPLTVKEEVLIIWIKRNTGEAKPSLGK